MGAWACLAGKPVFPAAASDECRVLVSLPFSVFRGAGGCVRSPRPPPAPPLPGPAVQFGAAQHLLTSHPVDTGLLLGWVCF